VVPVTVYVVVETGLAVTVAPVVALRPVAGAHVYVVAPLAVKLVPTPEHTEADEGVTVTVGVVLTVMATDWVELHEPLVPVTVYVVVEPGVAVTVAPVVALKPVEGLQV
jgi:hypothetical protein